MEPVCCSMSSSNCCFLICIQISQEAGQLVWYSHLFRNFPQFVVIHTVKGCGAVNKAEADVLLVPTHTQRLHVSRHISMHLYLHVHTPYPTCPAHGVCECMYTRVTCLHVHLLRVFAHVFHCPYAHVHALCVSVYTRTGACCRYGVVCVSVDTRMCTYRLRVSGMR